ncbi:MAG TPA: two-component regulator propeller domain-containing protein, partial [Candidatus Eisenbacteria bacterium]
MIVRQSPRRACPWCFTGTPPSADSTGGYWHFPCSGTSRSWLDLFLSIAANAGGRVMGWLPSIACCRAWPGRWFAPVVGLIVVGLSDIGGALPARAAWQNFKGSRDGLADSQVLAIHEAPDGSLWFGTPRGPSHYDGLRWTSPDLGTTNPVVQCITPTSNGNLWFGLQGGGAVLFHTGNGRHEILSSGDGPLPSDNVQAILEDRAGDTWFGTPNGLARRVA